MCKCINNVQLPLFPVFKHPLVQLPLVRILSHVIKQNFIKATTLGYSGTISDNILYKTLAAETLGGLVVKTL